MSYPNYDDFDEEDMEDEDMSKEERRIERLKDRQKKLPLLLGGFSLGGFIMGVAYSFYMRKSKKK